MEEELIKIWQSSPNQERIKFDKSRLMIEVESSMDQFHKKIKFRDLLEQVAIVAVSPVFAYYAYSVPYVLSKIASVMIILWGFYVFIRLQNAKKHKPGTFTETYLQYLYKTREYLNVQKELLDNILYWYILPAMSIASIFLAGFIGVPGKLEYIVKTWLFGAVGGAAIYYLNKRGVQKELVPRLTKVDELINLMENV